MINERNIQGATRKTNIGTPLSKPTKNKLPQSLLLYSGERREGGGDMGDGKKRSGSLDGC